MKFMTWKKVAKKVPYHPEKDGSLRSMVKKFDISLKLINF